MLMEESMWPFIDFDLNAKREDVKMKIAFEQELYHQEMRRGEIIRRGKTCTFLFNI